MMSEVTYFSHDAIMKNIRIDSHYTYAMNKVLAYADRETCTGNSMVQYSKCLESVEWNRWTCMYRE